MTPKEAFGFVYGHSNCYCENCKEALRILEALVERPTVWEVREEIQRMYDTETGTLDPDYYAACAEVLDFIDRKVPHD